MTYSRAVHLSIAKATPGYDRVKLHDGPLVRLDWKTGIAAPYPRQQRRSRDREEAREPSFSDRLAFALSQIEWLDIPGNFVSAMGLFSVSPMSKVINRRVKRYRAAYLSERQDPSADYQDRYKALFPVL